MQKSSVSDQFELSNLCGRLRLRNIYSLKSTYGSHPLFHCPQDSTILLRLSFLSTGFYVIRIKNFLHKWILSQMSVSTSPHSFQKCRECYSFILSHNEMVWWENTGSEFNTILCECISGVYFILLDHILCIPPELSLGFSLWILLASKFHGCAVHWQGTEVIAMALIGVCFFVLSFM